MKRLFFALQLPLFLACNFFLFTAIIELVFKNDSGSSMSDYRPQFDGKEDYDPSLGRLTSLSEFEQYCDSIYADKSATDKNIRFEEAYPQIAVHAARLRFYHGYSTYGFSNNYTASLFEPLTGTKASAIVLPDDILKYPYAACSQQSIVVLALLKNKNFKTRVVSFHGNTMGHFSFETYYNGSWHFFDPNMEPDEKLMQKYNRPEIAYLAGNLPLLLSAYKQFPKEKVIDVFTNYKYEEAGATIAPWASFYQHITKFLSYTLWIFFLVSFIIVRKKYQRLSSIPYVRNSRVHFPQLQQGAAPLYHLGY